MTGEQHLLTASHLRRLQRFEEKVLPRQLKKKRFARRFGEVDRAFGDALSAIVSKRPVRSTGKWKQPSQQELDRARRLILARLLVYARHDPRAATTPAKDFTRVRKQLRRSSRLLKSHIALVDASISSDVTEHATALSELKSSLDTILALSVRYARSISAGKAKSDISIQVMEFISLVCVETNGTYPTVSARAALPKLERIDTEPFELIVPPPPSTSGWHYDAAPPLLQLAKCLVESVEAGVERSRKSGRHRPEKTRIAPLRNQTLETTVNKLRKETLT